MTQAPTAPRAFLFVVGNTREPGHLGNTETLARRAADALPAEVPQRWVHLAPLNLPPFVDIRHTVGNYPMPEGPLRELLDATLAATDLVIVAPVYWYSLPSPLKTYLDHWSAFLRVPGLDFKARMAGRRFWAVATSGNRAKAQPMLDSLALSAEFMGMRWMPPLWGQGGAPDAVRGDATAWRAAEQHFLHPLP
jgi:NAD(P)H-dependent FMN reductase